MPDCYDQVYMYQNVNIDVVVIQYYLLDGGIIVKSCGYDLGIIRSW
jgi:hypothetical protein